MTLFFYSMLVIFIILQICILFFIIKSTQTDTYRVSPHIETERHTLSQDAVFNKYVATNLGVGTCSITYDQNNFQVPPNSQTSIIVAQSLQTQGCQITQISGNFKGPTTPPTDITTIENSPSYTVSWQYGKQGDTFKFFGDPVVSPRNPATLVIGANANVQHIGVFTVNGSLLVADANNTNKYNVVITMKSGHKGFARGLIPYFQIFNKTRNTINLSFRDESNRRIDMDIDVDNSLRINMETGVTQKIEINIVTLASITAGPLLGMFAIWFVGGILLGADAAVVAEEVVPLIPESED